MTDLFKVPDYVIIEELKKERSNLNIEIGKLNSYIDELKDSLNKFKESVRIEVRKEEINRLKENGDWQRMLNQLSTLKEENRRLLTRLSDINANKNE